MVPKSLRGLGHHVSGAVDRCRTSNDLLVEVGHGDLDALARLYDEFAHPVYLMANRAVHDPRVSADVTQEVFLRVWREAGEFDPARSSAWAWIYERARASTQDGRRSSRGSHA